MFRRRGCRCRQSAPKQDLRELIEGDQLTRFNRRASVRALQGVKNAGESSWGATRRWERKL